MRKILRHSYNDRWKKSSAPKRAISIVNRKRTRYEPSSMKKITYQKSKITKKGFSKLSNFFVEDKSWILKIFVDFL